MERLRYFKLNKRITTNAFDEEILQLFDEAEAKLGTVCDVHNANEKMVDSAIITYAKANFGTNPDRELFMNSFNSMMAELSIKFPCAPGGLNG